MDYGKGNIEDRIVLFLVIDNNVCWKVLTVRSGPFSHTLINVTDKREVFVRV